MSALTGGCACRNVRFRLEGAPRFAFLCQCRDCQKMTGSDHAAQVCHDADRFSSEGETLTWERTTAAETTVTKHVCPICASPLWGTTTRAPTIVMIMAGALDDPNSVTPDRIFFADERITWDHASVPEKNP